MSTSSPSAHPSRLSSTLPPQLGRLKWLFPLAVLIGLPGPIELGAVEPEVHWWLVCLDVVRVVKPELGGLDLGAVGRGGGSVGEDSVRRSALRLGRV